MPRTQLDGGGFDNCGLKSVGQSKCFQHPSGIGGELNAGASFLKLFRLIEQLDPDPPLRQRQGRRQPADAGTGDQYAVQSHFASAAPSLPSPACGGG